MSLSPLEDLPDEIKKLNLFGKKVPYGFIEKAVQNGCEYLNLSWSHVHGGEESELPWKLKYLEISRYGDLPKVLEKCRSLQKLAMDFLELDSDAIEQICQNGETLRILSLGWCSIDIYQRTESIQKLLTKCSQLTELNLARSDDFVNLLDPDVRALVDNLTINILKLSLSRQGSVTDEHVNTLVRRCNKITELDLSGTSITKDSIESIVRHLNSLEKLDLNFTDIDLSKILLLKSIPTLKILHCFYGSENTEKVKNLKQQLPHISVNDYCSNAKLHSLLSQN